MCVCVCVVGRGGDKHIHRGAICILALTVEERTVKDFGQRIWEDDNVGNRHPCDTKTVHKQTFGLNEGHVTNNEDVIRVRHLQATLAGPGMGLDETYW